MDEQVVLGELVDVLLCSLLRKTGDPSTISSHLPTDDLPKSELWTDRIHYCIFVLDYLQFYLQLYPYQLLLDT